MRRVAPVCRHLSLTVLVLLFLFVHVSCLLADFDPFGDMSEGDSTVMSMSLQGPEIPSVEFTNDDITMAFRIISDATGWSIFPTPEVSRAQVSLWARDITAGQLLDTVVRMSGFIYHCDGTVITVMTYPEYMQYYGLSRTTINPTFARAETVAAAIRPFLTRLGVCEVHQETNSIVIYDTDANLDLLIPIMEELDRPSSDTVVEVVLLRYTNCQEVAQILEGIFTSSQSNSNNRNRLAESGSTSNAAANSLESGGEESLAVSLEPISVLPVEHSNQIVLVGHTAEVEQARELIARIDIASENSVLRVIDIEYADAIELTTILREIFSISDDDLDTARSATVASGVLESGGVEARQLVGEALPSIESEIGIYAIGRTNQIVLKGFGPDLDVLIDLIQQLDTDVESISRTYHFSYIDVAEIFDGLYGMLDMGSRRSTDVSTDHPRNMTRGNAPGRQASREYVPREQSSGGQASRRYSLTHLEQANSVLLTGPPSTHRMMTSFIEAVDVPTSYETSVIRTYKLENADVSEVADIVGELLTRGEDEIGQASFQDRSYSDIAVSTEDISQSGLFVSETETRVSVSESTNSVVVRASSRQHRELEQLIEELDRRRRQVVVEALIVQVTTTDDMELGVELDELNATGIAFTSFGLTSVNQSDGQHNINSIIVSPGGTAALLDPDRMRAVIQALESNENVRIESAPRILVNDNAVGFINSISEEPYTQVNASDTVATTSFGGFVEAGTQFSVIPHISERNYLRMEYEITLNHFRARTSAMTEMPPPRNTDSIKSEATVPENYTIVVGGLRMVNDVERIDKVPILGDIPLLGLLFRSTVTNREYKTIYLFMTPSIMEDEDFADLRLTSDESWQEAQGRSRGAEIDSDISLLVPSVDEAVDFSVQEP